ncbi:MAG: T4 prohead core scaffold protein, partial [Gammaproteobacteria bacterium]|nr:T4 prohead core scaffold protein [Gammaproteobacteria bacterium]
MSRGNNLQEMEVGTKQSKTAVNAGPKADEAAGKSATPVATPGQTGGWEDLGGPTPENSRPDDNSNMLKTPGATLKTVSDVVNKGAKAADPMKKLAAGAVKEETEEEEDLVDEVEEEELEGEEVEEETVSEAKEKEEEDEEDEEDEDEDEDEKKMKKEEFDIEEDVNALMNVTEEEELSEEFKEKAKTIFESALRSKVSEIRESMEVKYEQRLIEEVEEIKADLQERVDSYLEYVADEWLSENHLSVEMGLKEELTESFMTGLKGLFEEHYVSIPEDKYDVLESMVEKLDEME